MQLHWLMVVALVFLFTGCALLGSYLLPHIITAVRAFRMPAPRIRHITGCFLGFALFCGAWVAFVACASARPYIQDARDEFVKACNALTAAELGDAPTTKVERVARKVCLVEKMGEAIEKEVVNDAAELDLFQPSFDAGAR